MVVGAAALVVDNGTEQESAPVAVDVSVAIAVAVGVEDDVAAGIVVVVLYCVM